MNIKHINNKELIFCFTFIIINIFMFSVFSPSYEWPDEKYHLEVLALEETRNYYQILLSHFTKLTLSTDFNHIFNLFSWVDNPNFSFFSDTLKYKGEMIFEFDYKIAHTFNVLLFVLLFPIYFFFVYCSSIRNKPYPNAMLFAFLVYFLFPSVCFSLNSFSSEFFLILFAPVVPILLIRKSYIILSLVCFFLIKEDRSSFSNVIFFISFVFFNFINTKVCCKSKLLFLFFVVTSAFVISLIIKFFVVAYFPNSQLTFDLIYNSGFNNNPIYKLGALVSSLYYLGGNLSLRAFWFEYVIFIVLIVHVFIIVINRASRIDFYLLMSSIVPPIFIITLMPPLCQGRYYYFILFVLAYLFYKYTKFYYLFDRRFRLFCIISLTMLNVLRFISYSAGYLY